MILRTIHCDVPGCCEAPLTESAPGAGWPGWGQLLGITVGPEKVSREPGLCPNHLRAIAGQFFGDEVKI